MLSVHIQLHPIWCSSAIARPSQEVLAEIALGLVLDVYWKCYFTRAFVQFLSAADASTSFGLRFSTTSFPEDLLWAVARWSETQGVCAVPDSGVPFGIRLGLCLELDLRLAEFSAQCATDAFLSQLYCVIASPGNASDHVVLMIDANARVGKLANDCVGDIKPNVENDIG